MQKYFRFSLCHSLHFRWFINKGKGLIFWFSWMNHCTVQCSVLFCFVFSYFSLEEFHQHMVLEYAEKIFVILRYIWPESKSKRCKCVHVEHSEIWVKKTHFLVKNMFLAHVSKLLHFFFLSMRIDNNFLITISDDLTTYLL